LREQIEKLLNEHQEMIDIIKNELTEKIETAARICSDALLNGKKLMFCGNGGSAADSQHLTAEFVGHFQTERPPLPAIALTTNTSTLTAIANDDGYDVVFSRQVEALGQPGDVLFGISTSGNSKNVILAIEKATAMGLKTITMTGYDGGKLAKIASLCLNVPLPCTARVQEGHILIGHIICALLDDIKTGQGAEKK
jgi:D-sedoheptulose 7-phosphate isomerase